MTSEAYPNQRQTSQIKLPKAHQNEFLRIAQRDCGNFTSVVSANAMSADMIVG